MIFPDETALGIALAIEDERGYVCFVLIHLGWHMFHSHGPSAGFDERGVGVIVVRLRVSRHQALPALDPVLGKLTLYS